MYDYWYYYVNLKYRKKSRLCYLLVDIFTVHVKSEDIFIDLAGDVKKRFGISNHQIKKLLRYKLQRKTMKEFLTLRPKTHIYLTDDGCIDGKANSTQKMCH